jgi:hypothetical protein
MNVIGIRLNIALWILIVWWGFGNPASAYEKEYFLLETTRPKNVAVLKEQISREHVTVLGLTLGENTLFEAEHRLGPAKAISVGHDGVVICYRSARRKDDMMIAFGADTHGDQKLISFQLIAGQQPFKAKGKCSPSPLISNEAATKSGLKLGVSNAIVKKILNAPMTETNGHLIIDYDYQEATSYESEPACLMVFASSAMRFERDKLVWLLVTRGTEGYRGVCKKQNDE